VVYSHEAYQFLLKIILLIHSSTIFNSRREFGWLGPLTQTGSHVSLPEKLRVIWPSDNPDGCSRTCCPPCGRCGIRQSRTLFPLQLNIYRADGRIVSQP